MPTVKDRNYIASGAITPKLRNLALGEPRIGLMELLEVKIEHSLTDFGIEDILGKMKKEYANLPLHIVLYVEGFSPYYYKFTN